MEEKMQYNKGIRNTGTGQQLGWLKEDCHRKAYGALSCESGDYELKV